MPQNHRPHSSSDSDNVGHNHISGDDYKPKSHVPAKSKSKKRLGKSTQGRAKAADARTTPAGITTKSGSEPASSKAATSGATDPTTVEDFDEGVPLPKSLPSPAVKPEQAAPPARGLVPEERADQAPLRERSSSSAHPSLPTTTKPKPKRGSSNQTESSAHASAAAADDDADDDQNSTTSSQLRYDDTLRREVSHRWILTLSMHFRDGAHKEKFFITYLRRPNEWLRVSVSVDYANAEAESLEEDLATLTSNRDKSFLLFKAVHRSLEDINWFEDSITNLKIETRDERLHIHVSEDVNERIEYPPLSIFKHLDLAANGYFVVPEEDVYLDQHLAGFVYKVLLQGQVYVKKEIPSIDTVAEFIYEIESLARVRASKFVINLAGVIYSDIDGERYVTGILLEYAPGGALNDWLYEHVDDELDWNTKMTWIRQIVHGMSDIHEAGLVQGDCTLSNMVLDRDNNVKVVDINRRGCPIGWEPTEFKGMIASGQRISMFIGVKSDIYQMGMIIWAIANQVEEPDRAHRPFEMPDDPDVPKELKEVLKYCLADNPVDRKSAKELLSILLPFEAYPRYDTGLSMKDLGAMPTREEIEASRKRYRRPARSEEASNDEGHPSDDGEDMDPLTGDVPLSTGDLMMGLGAIGESFTEDPEPFTSAPFTDSPRRELAGQDSVLGGEMPFRPHNRFQTLKTMAQRHDTGFVEGPEYASEDEVQMAYEDD